MTRINLVGRDKYELSIDRNRIFWKPDQLQNLKRLIRHGLVDVANQLMTAVKAQEVSVNTLNSIVNHLAIFGVDPNPMSSATPHPAFRGCARRRARRISR